MNQKLYIVYILLASMMVVSCGDKSTSGTTTPVTNPTNPTNPTAPSSTPAQIALSVSSASVKSDNSTSSDVTATVLDSKNAVVSNATVLFEVTGGQISASSAVTDANGRAVMTFSAGTQKTNQVAVVTATLGGVTPTVSSTIPIKIVGTIVKLTAGKTNITSTLGGGDTLSVLVLDAGGVVVQGVPVSVTQTGAGSVTLSPSAAVTDGQGSITVGVLGATQGSATVTVAAGGAIATQPYTVTTIGSVFSIISPLTDPYSIGTNTLLPVTVNVPAGILNVSFATSLGAWGNGLKITTIPVVAGSATANLMSPQSGLATVQAYDALNITTSDSLTVAFSQPASSAAQISLQASSNVLAPSLAGSSNSVTLTATVLTSSAAGGQAVGGAPVLFSIPVATGGGEFISPVVALTDASGKAITTFTSGSISTGGSGVNIEAALINNPAVLPAAANVVIGGTPASVVIGRGTKIQVPNATEYIMPMSVLVSDGNGNAVPGVPVTLKAFPVSFSTGLWIDADPDPTKEKFYPCVTGTFSNEDINRNTVLDLATGEDVARTTLGSSCDIYGAVSGAPITYIANKKLDAPSSAAGSLPPTVVTDVNGVANFDLVYLKGSAAWINDEITAQTSVSGTEATTSIVFTLPYEKVEGEAGALPASVFGK